MKYEITKITESTKGGFVISLVVTEKTTTVFGPAEFRRFYLTKVSSLAKGIAVGKTVEATSKSEIERTFVKKDGSTGYSTWVSF